MEAVASPTDANAVLGSFGSPSRVGVFARSSGSNRALSGATYYGIMNMSDNVAEITVYAGSVEGRNIAASVHGDGYLAANAYTNIPSWLPNTAFGFRGGGYSSVIARGRVSDRNNANFYTNYPNDYFPAGQTIRLARTAF